MTFLEFLNKIYLALLSFLNGIADFVAFLFHHGEGHFITIAAPGGGKTTAALVPTMWLFSQTAAALSDPRRRGYENASRTTIDYS